MSKRPAVATQYYSVPPPAESSPTSYSRAAESLFELVVRFRKLGLVWAQSEI
jgi:hypothetical protein